MRALTSTAFSLSLLVLAVSCVLLVPSPGDEARAQSCSIAICKSAEGAGDTPFVFDGERPGDSFDFELTAESLCLILGLDPTLDLSVTERATEGWELADIDCEADDLIISGIPNGIFVQCLQAGGGGTFTFVNVPDGSSIAAIPTLSEWGMFAVAAGLGFAGVLYAVRRRRAAA